MGYGDPAGTAPIGISFLPTAENQAQGPQQGQLEGDLGSAFRILSLRLPRVLGAKAISSPDLLAGGTNVSPGSNFNPHAAVFEALLRALAAAAGGGTGTPGTADASSSTLSGGSRLGAPNVVFSPKPPTQPFTPSPALPSVPTTGVTGGTGQPRVPRTFSPSD
jgi:hypothetical protein